MKADKPHLTVQSVRGWGSRRNRSGLDWALPAKADLFCHLEAIPVRLRGGGDACAAMAGESIKRLHVYPVLVFQRGK
jgi:hypothetical protein